MRLLPTLPALLLLNGCFTLFGDGHHVTETRRVGAFQRVENRTLVRVEVTLGERAPAEVSCDENLLDRLVTEVVGDTLVIRTTRPGFGMVPSRKCTLEVGTDALVEAVVDGSGGVIVHGIADGFERAVNDGSGRLELDTVRGGEIEVLTDGSGGTFVEAVVADVVHVEHEGSGPVDLLGLDVEEVWLRHDGSGHVELAGATRLLDIEADGSGGVYAADLAAEDVDVHMTGSGSVTVHASGEVTGRMTGSGSLEVEGDPAHVDVDNTGSGRVIRR